MWQILHASFWKSSKLSNTGISFTLAHNRRSYNPQYNSLLFAHSVCCHNKSFELSYINRHRRSQNFLWVHFSSPKKLSRRPFFSRRPQNTGKTPKWPLPSSRFPQFLQNWTLALPGDALTTFPCKFALPHIFTSVRPWGGLHVHPMHPLATPMSTGVCLTMPNCVLASEVAYV